MVPHYPESLQVVKEGGPIKAFLRDMQASSGQSVQGEPLGPTKSMSIGGFSSIGGDDKIKNLLG